jgi:hypothetical protein
MDTDPSLSDQFMSDTPTSSLAHAPRHTIALERSKSARLRLSLILLVGLVHGLLYVFAVPPWQHYDEPAHFEYAWLIANRMRLPQTGDYDQPMRRALISSMTAHQFFRDLGRPPDVNVPDDRPIPIGYTQLPDPPAYYMMAAIPMWLLRAADFAVQLRAARLISLLLFLVTLAAAYGLVSELTSPDSPLRWMVPLTLALLPGLAELMTAMNNHVGAIAFLSLYFWCGVRLIQRGFTRVTFLASIGLVVLCIFTEKMTAIALFLLPIGLLLALIPRGLSKWLFVALVSGVLAGSLLFFTRSDAKFWNRSGTQDLPLRCEGRACRAQPLGEHALQLQAEPGEPALVAQTLPSSISRQLLGKTVSIGAWIWADRPVSVTAPQLGGDWLQTGTPVNVDERPTFFAYTITLPANGAPLRLYLGAAGSSTSTAAVVYYDGIVVAEGVQPVDQPPHFDDRSGDRGVWGDRPFENAVRNGSAETPALSVRPSVNRIGERLLKESSPSVIVASLQDLESFGDYYASSAHTIFRTFWARFGWGHVPLLYDRAYSVLLVVTAAGLAGAAWFIARCWRMLPLRACFWLGLALAGVWVAAITRGTTYALFYQTSFIPVARYGFPAIVPTVLVLAAGWLESMRIISRGLKIPFRWMAGAYVTALVAFDVFAFASLIVFYANR